MGSDSIQGLCHWVANHLFKSSHSNFLKKIHYSWLEQVSFKFGEVNQVIGWFVESLEASLESWSTRMVIQFHVIIQNLCNFYFMVMLCLVISENPTLLKFCLHPELWSNKYWSNMSSGSFGYLASWKKMSLWY